MFAQYEGPPFANAIQNEDTQAPLPVTAPGPGPEYSALVARATNDAVRDWDVTSGRLNWPQGLRELFGFDPAAVEPAIGFWQQRLHPEDRARAAAAIRDAVKGEAGHWSGEYRFRAANGTYLQILERACIQRDEKGRAVRFVGSLMDITARRQLQEQVCRSQRMEAFGQLAGGVAHDLNNFLTTILGYSDLVLADAPARGHLRNHLGEIRKAAQRASTLAGQLLAFSRKHPLQPRVLEINTVLANLESTLLPLLGENISVVAHPLKTAGAHVRFDPGQLTQVLLNICLNGRDAMPEGGQLDLSTGLETVTSLPNAPSLLERMAPGRYVVITIRDSGTGLAEEARDHLFEPFFSTREGRSGLGLATSYGLIRQSGGDISLSSQSGQGTEVRIYLPLVPAPSEAAPRRSERNPTGSETILVLEDDIGVRHFSIRVLRSLGYNVLEAASSDDAQRFISERSHPVHLLLTDIVMPKMSGRNFADWLGRTSPETKVVFISGYLDESLPDPSPESDLFFLAKPFSPEQLALKVRTALDRVPPRARV